MRDQDIDPAMLAELKRRNVGYIPTLTRDLSVLVYETMVAPTGGAARVMKLDKQLGTLEPGNARTWSYCGATRSPTSGTRGNSMPRGSRDAR